MIRENFLDIGLLRIWESLFYNFKHEHEDVTYYIPLCGELPEVVKVFRPKLLPATTQLRGLQLAHGLLCVS
jgi:hypothetical protein